MKAVMAALLFLVAMPAYSGVLLPGGVQLLCHRTANEDVPENTLESLEQAALLGCNVVEIDLRRTLDGKIVLNHDGILERLTDGVGDVETSYYADLKLRDAGSWMGQRFSGMHFALFEDALRLARDKDIRLVLDMKTKGMGPDVLQMLQREGMLKRVEFNGEWSDVKALYPDAKDVGDATAWVPPGVSAEQVSEYHHAGKAVVANFSETQYEMDVAAMKAAVAAGVDGINVDYPRLGADAVGRPVERRLHQLILQANAGKTDSRAEAILQLSRYSGFPLEQDFDRWLADPDERVSRAAAVALASAHPAPSGSGFSDALRSVHPVARANAVWVLGVIHAPSQQLLPMLEDKDMKVVEAVLLSLESAPGTVDAKALLPFLSHNAPAVRAAAAIALAVHDPKAAMKAVPQQLQREIASERVIYDDFVRRGKTRLSPDEIDTIMKSFRCQMEMMRALSLLNGGQVTGELSTLAFRPGDDFSEFDSIVAGFQLWDRIGNDAAPAVQALASSDMLVADRAEWMLVKAGPAVLPEVRKAMVSDNVNVRDRAIRIVAWQGDAASLDTLRAIQASSQPDAALAEWAITIIESLHP